MRKREDIRLEIKRIDEQVKEYYNDILELEESYKIVKMDYNVIVEKVYKPEKEYDLTPLLVCGKETYEQAEEYRNRITVALEKSLNDTLKFLSNVQTAIKNVQKEIEKCENKKKALEVELNDFGAGR
ncbi:hypothetical protein [Butyrivibrio sp. M55]|uniref:hypothetical protein n=1 Tax=Butyrivibrio sp. M55 TaxID=1855323 RepID=UPI0008F1D5DB|nr:hypothetical protein [Butyrivibrio sp. M55]SFU87662.1 hypothetical protein SAMN05216540_11616 [Butyrivibrio sp. M55]